jgi:hypothetical protein
MFTEDIDENKRDEEGKNDGSSEGVKLKDGQAPEKEITKDRDNFTNLMKVVICVACFLDEINPSIAEKM